MKLQPIPNYESNLLWVIPQNASGFGDIACALKIANHLMEKGQFTKENITIVSSKTNIISLFNLHAFKVISPEDAQTTNITPKKKLIKLVVPIRSYENVNLLLLKGGFPYIVFGEYGVKCQEVPSEISDTPHLVKTLGLKDDEEGILIDQELKNFSEQPQEKRLLLLEKIPSELRKIILENDNLDEAVNNFITTSKLYMGYASQKEYFKKFLKAIINLNQDNKKKLIFFFPVSADKILLPKNLKSVSTIEILEFDQSKQTVSLKETKFISENGKAIKIIYGSLSYNDLKIIQAVSCEETMVTGDQSLSLAISDISRRFLYEALEHKIDLANKLDDLYPECPSLKMVPGNIPKSKEIQSYFIRCMDKKEQFAQVSREICLNRNAFTKIPPLIESVYLNFFGSS